MKTDVVNLDAGEAGSVDLNDEIFGLEPRADILHRVVRWQRARKQAGTHKTKSRGETAYSTKKIYRQKGTGGARHGDRGVTQFRKGGTAKGPVVRSHAHDLPKKVRKLGLKMVVQWIAGLFIPEQVILAHGLAIGDRRFQIEAAIRIDRQILAVPDNF